ncbi:hypothetical protein MNBD_IGNAVI01-403 [hydrothermal vent metagenome]|uniref:Periplasmic copper-binding protein NosD beta helix domain-containing protein n=1 Tax=hydrothermal vent metagenome TaxID=652676 RepID=A0A3B1C8N0_9ZZZZ
MIIDMKTLFITIIFIALCSMVSSQNRVRNISKIGPSTEHVEKNNYAEIFYISQSNGYDEKGNGSRENPWKTIINAFNKVNNESENHVIAFFIAEGIYSGSTIEMRQFIDLFGGFDSKTWERDIYRNSTILDGKHKHRVVLGADNSRIDGFTITNGFADSDGGGILCDDTAPVISNCFIVNNFADKPDNFNDTRIHQQGNNGGGVACLYNATPEIKNNLFYNNKTSIGDGGALSFYGWVRKRHGTDRRIENNFMVGYVRPVVQNNVFVENISGVDDSNRTRSSNGGAISCSNEARPIIENNIIASNRAKGNSDAGGIYAEYFSYPTIKGNWIVGNISDDDGGGIYIMRQSHALITDNFIAGNSTVGKGVGGIRLSKEGRASIMNNIIVNNLTGGAVQCVDSYMEMKNNIVFHNKGKVTVQYKQHFDYFKPSEIVDNVIRKNEGNVFSSNSEVSFEENNVDQNVANHLNTNLEVKFTDQTITGKIVNINFDKKKFQSIIEIEKKPDQKSLVGRVIRIDDFWSVINNVDNNKLYIWGNAEKRALRNTDFKILSEYRIKK